MRRKEGVLHVRGVVCREGRFREEVCSPRRLRKARYLRRDKPPSPEYCSRFVLLLNIGVIIYKVLILLIRGHAAIIENNQIRYFQMINF